MGKSTISMAISNSYVKSTISMAISNSYVKLPEGISHFGVPYFTQPGYAKIAIEHGYLVRWFTY